VKVWCRTTRGRGGCARPRLARCGVDLPGRRARQGRTETPPSATAARHRPARSPRPSHPPQARSRLAVVTSARGRVRPPADNPGALLSTHRSPATTTDTQHRLSPARKRPPRRPAQRHQRPDRHSPVPRTSLTPPVIPPRPHRAHHHDHNGASRLVLPCYVTVLRLKSGLSAARLNLPNSRLAETIRESSPGPELSTTIAMKQDSVALVPKKLAPWPAGRRPEIGGAHLLADEPRALAVGEEPTARRGSVCGQVTNQAVPRAVRSRAASPGVAEVRGDRDLTTARDEPR
jgi:hypothetical protein